LLGVAGMAGMTGRFPRRALGAFYADQMAMLLAAWGPEAALRTHAVVQDVAASADGVAVTWDEGQARHEAMFDRVILASGYGRADAARPMAGQVAQGGQGRRIGVLGSSLSAIDAAMEIAMRRRRFEPSGTGLRYVADRPWASFLSRHALLPEADFWFRRIGGLALFNMRHVAPLARGAMAIWTGSSPSLPASWRRPTRRMRVPSTLPMPRLMILPAPFCPACWQSLCHARAIWPKRV
jgi:hypothetical protein